MRLFLAFIFLASACVADLSIGVQGSSADEHTQVFDWVQLNDTTFDAFCADGIGELPIALLDRTTTITRVLAVQTDGCIAPEDGAFDDIDLRAGSSYRLRVPSTTPVWFVLMF